MIESPARLEVGPLIARGFTAEVFAHGSERVLKLFHPWFRRYKIEREFAANNAVYAAGIAVPRAFEIVEVDGRIGIVFERLHGISMTRRVAQQPWRLIAAAREFTELHARMHECNAPAELPTQRELIEGWIADGKDLSADDRAAAKSAIENLPDGNAICHGDFHPENVLLTARGPMIIDWTNGSRGNPIGDVARTACLINRADIPDDWPLHLRVLVSISRKLLRTIYLRRYFELRAGAPKDIRAWEPIQKAALSAWRARMDAEPTVKGSSPP